MRKKLQKQNQSREDWETFGTVETKFFRILFPDLKQVKINIDLALREEKQPPLKGKVRENSTSVDLSQIPR